MSQEPRILSATDLENKRKEEQIYFAEQDRLRDEAFAKYKTAKKVSDKARESGSWIFDPIEKKWFTPDEFLEIYGNFFPDHQIFYQVKIMNPIEGVRAGYRQLEILQEKLKQFSMKVISYYRGI